MRRFFAMSIGMALFGSISQTQALELLASWQTFNTPTGAYSTTQFGQNGSTNYFSDLSMTFQNMVGSNNPVAPTTNPTFDQLQGTADGNPSTATGQWIQLNLTKAAPHAGATFTITNIIVRFWNDSGDPGTSQAEIHFYSNTGGFSFRPNSPQMNSNGTGIISSKSATPPVGTRSYVEDSATPGGTIQNNVITAGASSYQIRMAPDRMSGQDPHWAMATFDSTTINSQTYSVPANSVIAIFGTYEAPVPEPGTYVLSVLAVLFVGVIERFRRRKSKMA